MTIDEYGLLFRAALRETEIAVPAGTFLYRVAGEVREMASAYCSDGTTLLDDGDPVNALASFAYGLGWLDSGCALGLLIPDLSASHPPGAVDASIPDACISRLHEKTHRYRRMLHEALPSVEVGPDGGSPMYAGARAFLDVAGTLYADGVVCLNAGDLAASLCRLSYGYAWLDAGIRAGLLRILDRRDLFTV
jgi:hypothetical protein